MNVRYLGVVGLVVAVMSFTPAPAAGQGDTAESGWMLPRTADGHPDLQGVWANNSVTPFERPPQWAGKERLTDEELAELKAAAAQVIASGLDAQFGDQLVLKALAGLTDAESYDTTGVPRLGAGYNSYFQIFRTSRHVAVFKEMAHDAKQIPLDGSPHAPDGVRQWNGDSRGRWEGDTLVVETTNFSPKSNFRGSAEHLHLVERYTRVGPDTLNYEVRVTDATTWTRPWTVLIPLKRSADAVFEYACHEGNYGMEGILSGHRAQERADTEALTESR